MALLFKWNRSEEKNIAELHCHTNYSHDSNISPKEAVEAAVMKGITHLCITDHNSIQGALEAKDYAEEENYDIEIIIGEEIDVIDKHFTVKSGHVIGLGIENKIPEHTPIEEAVAEIKEQDGVAIAAHPYTYPRKMKMGFKAFTSQFDAVEAFNAVNWHLPGEWYTRRLSNKYEIPIVAGSDAHKVEDIGKCGILFQGDLLNSIKEEKFKWFGKKKNPLKVLSWFLESKKNDLKLND